LPVRSAETDRLQTPRRRWMLSIRIDFRNGIGPRDGRPANDGPRFAGLLTYRRGALD